MPKSVIPRPPPSLSSQTLNCLYPLPNAQMFAPATKKTFREINFSILNGEEGGKEDRPLIVQFCGNDPQQILTSAKVLEPYCDAVDINLGCPQDIAKKGKYGAFLQDEWDLIYDISEGRWSSLAWEPPLTSLALSSHFSRITVNTLHKNLSVPVTAKFRVFQTVEKTVEYAKMLERAGAQILTCHGRIREQRGHNTVGPFDHSQIPLLWSLLFATGTR